MITMSYVLGCFFTAIPLILGVVLTLFPPKKMNNMMYGFHMNSTMINQGAWDYGQKAGGRFMLIYSAVCTVIFAVVLIVFRGVLDELFYLRIIFGFVILITAPIFAFVFADRKTRKFNRMKRISA